MPVAQTLDTVCKTYLTQFRDQKKLTHSTGELSYREGLGRFLRESADVLGVHVDFTHEARQLTVGRPDYEVADSLTDPTVTLLDPAVGAATFTARGGRAIIAE